MIQFKKILHRKSVVLLLLFLTTVNGFLQDNARLYRRNDKNGNSLNMDRSLENYRNMPERKTDMDRQLNQKDRVAERLYDRRSFRTGTAERRSENIRISERRENIQDRERSVEDRRLSRDIRTDTRDVNNNYRDITRNLPNNRHYMPRENRQVRDNRVDRRTTEKTVFSRLGTNSDASTIRQMRTDRRERDSNNEGRRNTEETRRFRQYNNNQIDRRDNIVRQFQERRNRQLEDNLRVINKRSDERDVERRITQNTLGRRTDDRTRQLPQDVSRRFTAQSVSRQDRSLDRRITQNTLGRRTDDRTRQLLQGVSRRFTAQSVSSRDRSLDRREVPQIRMLNRQREDDTGRNDRVMSLESRSYITRFVNSQRFADTTLDRSRMSVERREERSRQKFLETRTLDRRIVDRRNLQNRNTRDDRMARVPIQSRSDSTRNIRDNVRVNDSRAQNRVSYRRDFITKSREDRREDGTNRHRSGNSRQSIDSDRYNALTADSRRYFERLVSDRTSTNSVRNTERAVFDAERNIDHMKEKAGFGIWANTAKVLLAVFLIGQILANSSKANKFRFHNAIMTMATSAKRKIQ